jgi:hypothetical protein
MTFFLDRHKKADSLLLKGTWLNGPKRSRVVAVAAPHWDPIRNLAAVNRLQELGYEKNLV